MHSPSSSRTPMSSPKEDIHRRWNDIQSPSGTLLIDPQNPWLLQEILRYGDFAQATSIAFKLGSYCGNCQHHLGMLLDQIRLNKHGYKVTKFIYAHLGSSGSMGNEAGAHRDDSNLIGYVAVSNEIELHRIGRRDIAVAWRGTKTWSEARKVIKTKLVHIDDDDDVMVADGFNSIYTSKTESSMYNKSSASEQVMGEVKRLVKLYKDRHEEVGLTITGHSLGGALALLNAYEAASSLPLLSICVVSFGAPQVGNGPFRDKLKQMEVKTIRVVIKQDMVPMWPGRLINENLYNWAFKLVGQENSLFKHVGKKLTLDADGFNMPEAHHLKTHLSHLNSSDGSASELPCGCSS
ncbi:phospholipase A1-Igamma1, chloroplastic-like [Magnolia sinica]|uniref:phospholipase A1-Igamma1, chloroplastic-like n=1 Tax=Magnolia sinica TaxID=86752 RepID=UPI002659377F|nr:phospholipase A1-Igamma1, chloroplastic-like [Magnolia sinica]